jgi:hypothetical protein
MSTSNQQPWKLDPTIHAWRTDRRVVDAALNLLPTDCAPSYALDPGAGEGHWGRGAKDLWGLHVTGVEIQPCAPAAGYDEWHTADLLTWTAPRQYDLIIGNPPFGKIGFPIIKRCLTEWLAPKGYALFYYHSRILASLERFGYYQHHAPLRVAHVVPRPSHTDDPATEKQGEYVAVLWRQGVHGYNGTGRYLGDWLYWRPCVEVDQLAMPLFAEV